MLPSPEARGVIPPWWAGPVAFVLMGVSGAAALGHETIWTRRMTDLLGSGSDAASKVFAGFFLGLALGAAFVANRSKRAASPWKSAAIAEFAVAALAVPMFFLANTADALWSAVGPENLTGSVGGFVKTAASLLFIVPPAFAMGAILPFVLEGVSRNRARPVRSSDVMIYAVNTLGGFVGILIVSLITLPELGMSGASFVAIGMNIVTAAGLYALHRVSKCDEYAQADCIGDAEIESPDPSADETSDVIRPRTIAFASGLGVMAAEIVALQLVMLAVPLSFYAPAAILAAFVLMLGVAAFVTPAYRRVMKSTQTGLYYAFAATGVAMSVVPAVYLYLVSVIGDISGSATILGFFERVLILVIVSVGPAILAAGIAFPLILDRIGGCGMRKPVPIGQVLAINGLGGLIGAEIASRMLLPNFGIHGSMVAIGMFYAIIAASLAPAAKSDIEAPGRAAFLAMIPAVAVIILGFSRTIWLPHVHPALASSVIDQEFGREGTVAVLDTPRTGRWILISNQYRLGSTAARWDQERQAHIPLTLHPKPADVAFLGLATGITPGAALEHPGVESVTAIELSSMIERASRRHFGDFDNGFAHDPRTRTVIEDARIYIAASKGRFDVVVGDLFLPWGSGEGRLFSAELFRSVRRSLKPGGLYCQWLPMYQLMPDHFESILATFLQAFPKTHLVFNGFRTEQPMLGLIGYQDGDIDWKSVATRCAENRSAPEVRDPTVLDARLLAMSYLGTRIQGGDSAVINTLGNSKIEFEAARERLTGNPGAKYIFGSRWVQWLSNQYALCDRPSADIHEPGCPPVPLRERVTFGLRLVSTELGRMTDAASGRPVDSLKYRNADDYVPPKCIRLDHADWTRWPASSPARVY
jgi:spermidine synthase